MPTATRKPRRLFSDLHPMTYRAALGRQRMIRRWRDLRGSQRFAWERQREDLPVKLYSHNSLIRRKLGNTQQDLQEGKAVSLGIAAPLVDAIVIRPGETFSFWRLVGAPIARRGFQSGVVISGNQAQVGIGGGMCQFTNLLHWLTLHSALTITEHHHHSGLDLFPDFNRQIPFGTGTSIVWNFLDYRVYNGTDVTHQYRVRATDEYLRGELRASGYGDYKYHVREEESYFYRTSDPITEEEVVRRHNVVLRDIRSKETGNVIHTERLLENDALVTYDPDLISADILPGKP